MKSNHYLLLFCVSLLILAMPWILTRPFSSEDNAFIKTGPIGDTIGGLTAPFIGIISAYLVFRAFKAQITANALVQEHFKFENFYQDLKALEDYIDNLEKGKLVVYHGDADSVTLRGGAYKMKLMKNLLNEAGSLGNESLKQRIYFFKEKRFDVLIKYINTHMPPKLNPDAKKFWDESFKEYFELN
jgi:hypothetical protein